MCWSSPIVLRYRLIKWRNELLEHPLYVIKIRSINELLRFSGNPHLRGEGKKVSCFRKRKNFSKKQPELNELRQTVHAFKIIIFRYFAFFLELTFYFLLFNHYYLVFLFIFVHDFLSVPRVQVATPLWINDFSKIQLVVYHQ